jgi:hypothetical protein
MVARVGRWHMVVIDIEVSVARGAAERLRLAKAAVRACSLLQRPAISVNCRG